MRKKVLVPSSRSVSPSGPASDVMSYETIIYEVDTADHVATITLNRPQVLNAFNRAMCHEVREVWQRIKADPATEAGHLDCRIHQARKDDQAVTGAPFAIYGRWVKRAIPSGCHRPLIDAPLESCRHHCGPQ